MSPSPNSLQQKQLCINRILRILGHSTLIVNGADVLFDNCLRNIEQEIDKHRTAVKPPQYFIDLEGFGDDDDL